MKDEKASGPDPALALRAEPASGFDASRFDPGQEDDPYWDYDENDCANCGGEGFVYGCSWDWQCDTYDEGEGTCLCTRRCDWCNPAPRTAEADALAKVLSNALVTESERIAQTPPPTPEDQ